MFSSVCSKSSDYQVHGRCSTSRSPDITIGVHVNNDDLSVDPSDQGNMFGYFYEEMGDGMLPTHSTATRVVCTSTRMIPTLALETRTSVMRLSMRLTHSITKSL